MPPHTPAKSSNPPHRFRQRSMSPRKPRQRWFATRVLRAGGSQLRSMCTLPVVSSSLLAYTVSRIHQTSREQRLSRQTANSAIAGMCTAVQHTQTSEYSSSEAAIPLQSSRLRCTEPERCLCAC